MNVSEQINSVINNLSEKLGVAAEKVYPMMLKQAYITLFFEVFMVLVCVAALVICYKVSMWIYKKCKDGYMDGIDYLGQIVAIIFVLIVCLIAIPLMIYDIISIAYNPQWYVISDILSKLKGN